MSETFIVRVDSKAGQRKTYFFDTIEEANAFVLTCEETIITLPTRIVRYTEGEAD